MVEEVQLSEVIIVCYFVLLEGSLKLCEDIYVILRVENSRAPGSQEWRKIYLLA
jgi:hypothetical protein